MRTALVRAFVSGLIAVTVPALLLFGAARAAPDPGARPARPAAPALAPAAPRAQPDLTADIVLVPPAPAPGQAATIQVTVRNQGTAATGGMFMVYLYVDPPQQPPTPGTPDAYYWQLPSMAAHGSSGLEFSYTFTSTGCNHVIYVWVDRANTIPESDEANNLVSLPVCVGVTCQPDTYEPDNSCQAAGWIAGDAQDRSLCPTGDVDWVQFTATAGVTYTMAATDLGLHADPLVALYGSCSSLSQFGTGPSFTWLAPASGVYYAQIRHRLPSYGPLATYKLRLTAASAGDMYEPDNVCTATRDITADGVRQTHLFQAAGDQDWVKFTIPGGSSFSIVADHTTPGISPVIAAFSGCDQTFGPPMAEGGQIDTIAPNSQTYYARVTNANATVYGPQARYDLAVTAIPCAADAYEPDNGAGTAKEILTNGASQTHGACPPGDGDWVRFAAEAGSTYVLHTSNLGPSSDTVLDLYGTDGAHALAHNDDYGYLLSSRIIWQCPATGAYYMRVTQHNPNVAGADTRYDLAVQKAQSDPDGFEPDNGPIDARPLVTGGQWQDRNFDPGPSAAGKADQDWVRFTAVAGQNYLIQTSGLGSDCDTVLEVYDHNGTTRLGGNDDHGPGPASAINFVAPTGGVYYVRMRQYNAGLLGEDTQYRLSITGAEPPTPTPSPTPPPTPTPSPTPAPPAQHYQTLILADQARIATLYGEPAATGLMEKLHQLAESPNVQGVVIQVETDPAVAAAYAGWIADPVNTARANDVAAAIRNLVLTFLDNSPDVHDIVIAGDDRVIPHRRVPEGAVAVAEQTYAISATTNSTIWGAVHDNMILTDDYYADRVPTLWQGRELYVPDYAVGRLIQTPDEIGGAVDRFLANPTLAGTRALVTGYDFVADAGQAVSLLVTNDNFVTDDTLIGPDWTGSTQRAQVANAPQRFDFLSLNGHANHAALGAPDGDGLTASQIAAGSADLSRAIVFTLGCHAGLDDSGSLSVAQAFARKGANFVGNTGFGWGGSGVVYSEKLLRNFAYNLVLGSSARTGEALAAAKRRYWQTESMNFGSYDEKALMEPIFYGIPQYRITTGATLDPGDPFPGVVVTATSPSSFGDIAQGKVSFGLAGSFGSLQPLSTAEGTFYSLGGSTSFGAGEPVQPKFYGSLSPAAAGPVRGLVFLGGVYSDVVRFNPIIGRPLNEYVPPAAEPAFAVPGWYPSVPFQLRAGSTVSSTAGSLVAVLGQYNQALGTERLYDRMSFATYFSDSPDTQPPDITRIDGVLRSGSPLGTLKVEADDPSGISRVLVPYTEGDGVWHSQDLAFDGAMHKWTGVVTATLATQFFVQVVDGAGNVAVDDNKGEYRRFLAPLPYVPGQSASLLFLPILVKRGR